MVPPVCRLAVLRTVTWRRWAAPRPCGGRAPRRSAGLRIERDARLATGGRGALTTALFLDQLGDRGHAVAGNHRRTPDRSGHDLMVDHQDAQVFARAVLFEQDTIAVLAGAGNRGLDVIGAGEMDADPLALLALDRFHHDGAVAPGIRHCARARRRRSAPALSGPPHRADAGSPACRHSGSCDRAGEFGQGFATHAATAEAEPENSRSRRPAPRRRCRVAVPRRR